MRSFSSFLEVPEVQEKRSLGAQLGPRCGVIGCPWLRGKCREKRQRDGAVFSILRSKFWVGCLAKVSGAWSEPLAGAGGEGVELRWKRGDAPGRGS